MTRYTTENIKSWITSEGIMYGINVADLLSVEHAVFHDRLYKYYHNPNSKPLQSEPLMYWRDPDTRNMVHMNAEFPYCMDLAIKNYGAPTYGIEAKHLNDLQTIFSGKQDVIDIIKQAFILK